MASLLLSCLFVVGTGVDSLVGVVKMARETFIYSFTQSNIGTSAQITDK